jgi:hypothetical protein
MGDLVRGGVGFVIAGALLVYLLRREVEWLLQLAMRRAFVKEFGHLESGAFLR